MPTMIHNAAAVRDSSGAPIEDDATYIVFLLTSLRVNAQMTCHAIIDGKGAKSMIANSSDPRYLHFVKEVRS